jgi:tRNA U54 and U55 pseudouridine synthase Pus10
MAEIIIKDNGYKISTNYDDVSRAILACGGSGFNLVKDKYKSYRLLSNDVDFYWGNKGFKMVTLSISYRNTELVRFENPNCQLIIDYLNKFEGLSRKEIEVLVLESQEVSKTQLELEVEHLKEEKEKLLKKVAILKEIEEKKEELKLLLTKLND